jgi:hypothetical protein
VTIELRPSADPETLKRAALSKARRRVPSAVYEAATGGRQVLVVDCAEDAAAADKHGAVRIPIVFVHPFRSFSYTGSGGFRTP